MKIYKILLIALLSISSISCSQANSDKVKKNLEKVTSNNAIKEKYKVTFVELGSVNCVPCKLMRPIMDEIEMEYSDQVKVVFHDVWTPKGKEDSKKYKIKLIPTQVFLDEEGKEYFRHEGFFPKEDLVKILKQKGVK